MTLTAALSSTLSLDHQEQQMLRKVLQDWPELQRTLAYLQHLPELLQGCLQTAQFYQGLCNRWAADLTTVKRICALAAIHSGQADSLPFVNEPETPPPASPAPPPTPVISLALRETVKQQLTAAVHTNYTHLARYLQQRGLEVNRNILRQLAQLKTSTAEELGETQLQRLSDLLTEFHNAPQTQATDPNRQVPLTENLTSDLQDIFYSSEIELCVLRTFIQELASEEEPGSSAANAHRLLSSLDDDALLHLLTAEPHQVAQHPLDTVALKDLIDLLHIRSAALALTGELERLEQSGWDIPGIALESQRLGYRGHLLTSDAEPNAEQVYELLPFLRRIHRTPSQAEPPATPENRLTLGSLTTHDQRRNYVFHLLEVQGGLVYTNDLAGPFGMRGSAMSDYLLNLGLEPIGKGGYRLPRKS